MPSTGSAATASLAVANCFLVVDDHEKALTFYRDVLGFPVTKDVSMGEFRWLSVATPTQPGLEITIQSVGGGPGVSEEDRAAIDTLLAKGLLTPLVFRCDDVDGAVRARAGVGAGRGAAGAHRPVLRRARLRVPRPGGQHAAVQPAPCPSQG